MKNEKMIGLTLVLYHLRLVHGLGYTPDLVRAHSNKLGLYTNFVCKANPELEPVKALNFMIEFNFYINIKARLEISLTNNIFMY